MNAWNSIKAYFPAYYITELILHSRNFAQDLLNVFEGGEGVIPDGAIMTIAYRVFKQSDQGNLEDLSSKAEREVQGKR